MSVTPPLPPLLLPSNAAAPHTEGPRLDFQELSAALSNAPLLYPSPKAGVVSKIEEGAASDLRQAWAAWRRRKSVGAYVSLSEKVGLPLALLLGRRGKPAHVLVAHNLTSERKRQLHARTGILHRFARIVVLCREQENYLVSEAGVPADRVCFVPDKVDHRFWAPAPLTSPDAGYILSVGRERRDYAALFAAARLLPNQRFLVVAGSPWSRDAHITDGDLPANISFQNDLSWSELRALYAGAAAVVVPLEAGTRYAAGVNAVLEAMAMGKPLVVSQTPGIVDYIDNGENALFVPPADPASLAACLKALLADPPQAVRLGAAARCIIEGGRNLDTYTANLARIVREAMSEDSRS